MTDDRTDGESEGTPATQPLTKYAEEAYADHPFVKVTEGGPGEGVSITNVGLLNAAELSFIQGLRERVNRIAGTIQEHLDRDGGRPVDMPVGEVGIGLFELHVVTASFFESCSTTLGSWAIQMDNELGDSILAYMQRDDDIDALDGADTHEEQLAAASEFLVDDATMFQYLSMWSEIGVLDRDLNDLLHTVRMRRNRYVHSPLALTDIEDPEEVISIVSECVTAANSVQEWMEAELPVDERFYSLFVDGG